QGGLEEEGLAETRRGDTRALQGRQGQGRRQARRASARAVQEEVRRAEAGRKEVAMNRSRSRAAFARAKSLIPGGVNSPARAFGAVGGHPVFIARGDGPYLYDIDGNR